MAEQVSGLASGATGAGLGGLTGTLQGGVNNLLNTGSSILDRFFPPEKREELKAKISKFATERPQMAAFLLSQIALSGFPLALFVIMSITVLIFALVAGILVGVVGALLFTVTCVGIALIILLPTLFMTTFAGVFIFLWGLGAYYIVKWFNKKDVPGVHGDLKDGMQKQMGLGDMPGLDGKLPGMPEEKQPKAGGQVREQANGHADRDHSSGPGQKKPKKESTPQGAVKSTGADAGNAAVSGVSQTANGVKGGVDGVHKKATGVVGGVTGKVGL